MGQKEWKKIRHGIIIFVMAFFSAIPFVVYGLDILIMEGLSIWTKMGSIQDMAWNCWIRSLSIPDGSTNMCMTHGTIY